MKKQTKEMNQLDKLRYITLACQSIILECSLVEQGIEPFSDIERRIRELNNVINRK